MKVFSPQVWGSHLGQEKAVVKNHSSALLQTKYSDTSRCQKSTNDGLMSIINQSGFVIWNKATIEILQQSMGNLSGILIPTILINLLCINKSHSQIINRTHWEFCLYVTILQKGGLLTSGAQGEELPYMDYIGTVQLREERTCHLIWFGFWESQSLNRVSFLPILALCSQNILEYPPRVCLGLSI